MTCQKCINKTACMTNHHLSSESCLKQSHALSKLSVIDHHAKSSSFIVQLGLQIKKIVAEAEAVENNSEIAREYGISESMVRRWRKDQANLFNGELKMSAKRKTMGCYAPKYPELDQTLLEWFSEQRSQGKFFVLNQNQLIPVISIELPCLLKP